MQANTYLSTHTHTAENKAAEWEREREREREREIRGSWSSSLGLRAYGQHFYLSQVLHTFRRIFHIHSPCESVCACVCALSKRICVKERSVWALPRFVFSFFFFLFGLGLRWPDLAALTRNIPSDNTWIDVETSPAGLHTNWRNVRRARDGYVEMLLG